MILKLYSIKDIDGEFSSPFVLLNDNSALRAFRNLASDLTTVIGKDPKYFSLYRLGSFDTDSGCIEPLNFPDFFVNAKSVLDEGDE